MRPPSRDPLPCLKAGLHLAVICWGKPNELAERTRAPGERVHLKSSTTSSDAQPPESEPEIVQLHVLVVDDEASVREVAVRALEFEGLRASSTDSGAAALELVRCQRFDCIVLDLTMPTLSGPDTLRAIREVRASVPVLLISGRRDGEVDRLLRDHERLGFLAKPFTPSQLKAAVEGICGN